MNSLSRKEKIASICIIGFAFVLLASGINDMMFQGLDTWDFVNVIAVFLLFIGVGLTPSIFFTPVKTLFSADHKPKTLIDSRLQQTILFTGLLLAIICVVQQVY